MARPIWPPATRPQLRSVRLRAECQCSPPSTPAPAIRYPRGWPPNSGAWRWLLFYPVNFPRARRHAAEACQLMAGSGPRPGICQAGVCEPRLRRGLTWLAAVAPAAAADEHIGRHPVPHPGRRRLRLTHPHRRSSRHWVTRDAGTEARLRWQGTHHRRCQVTSGRFIKIASER